MRIGTNELLIILVVVLLIFGPKNLPKLGKMFGKTMNNFRRAWRSPTTRPRPPLQRPRPRLRRRTTRSNLWLRT